MKKRIYSRPVCVTLSEQMFKQLETITREREVSLSEYVREALQEKFGRKDDRYDFCKPHEF